MKRVIGGMTKIVQKKSKEAESNEAKTSKFEDMKVSVSMKNLLVSHF